MKKISAILKKLTFDDLRDWAGAKILGRGQGYIDNVDQLSRTADGGLAAWVSGGEEYATSVQFDADGDLESFCTCPFDGEPCKHAVAVVLAAAREIKKGKSLPLLAKDDDLYLALLDDEDAEEEAWSDEDDEEAEEVPVRGAGKGGRNPVAKILAAKSREELLALLVDLAGRHPEVARRILEDEQLAGGQVDKIVRALRLEIKNLTAEPAWSNHWNDEGNQPDYSHVREQLRALLAKGHADQVLQLGEELWRGGNSQVAESDDEGECAMEIGDCLAEVLRALPNSSLSPAAQLLWVIDRQLQDE